MNDSGQEHRESHLHSCERPGDEATAALAQIHQLRLRGWSSPWRCWLLRIALGKRTYGYMLRSIKHDPRTPGAKLVDIVIRQDAVERRIEADWVKDIARMAYHLPSPPLG